jgi:membrane-bound lytic murein transglycosylase F
MYRHILCLLLMLLSISGCDSQTPSDKAADTGASGTLSGYEPIIEKGDLDALRERGFIRILTRYPEGTGLPRYGSVYETELENAKEFVESLGLTPVVIPVKGFDELPEYLDKGRGDLVADNITITEARKKRVDFSAPIYRTHESLVGGKDAEVPEEGDALDGKTLVVTTGTTFANTARALAEKHKGLKVIEDPDITSIDAIEDVAAGKYDFTIADGNFIFDVTAHRKDIKVLRPLSEAQLTGWAVRKGSPGLIKAINKYNEARGISSKVAEDSTLQDYRPIRLVDKGDFDQIKARGYLRVGMFNTVGSYYISNGEIAGFEYDLLHEFCDAHDLRIQVHVAYSLNDLKDWLEHGEIDVASAFLRPTEARAKKYLGTKGYLKGRPVLIGSKDRLPVSPEALKGRTIHVDKLSTFADFAQQYEKEYGAKVAYTPEDSNTYELFEKISSGDYDLSIINSHTYQLEAKWNDTIGKGFDVEDTDHDYVWGLRKNNPKLKEALDAYITKKIPTKDYAWMVVKYFQKPKVLREDQLKLMEGGKISKYDDIVKREAKKYHFNWIEIVALMHQESKFNPKARSYSDARGLMQLKPATGRDVGITDLYNPEQNIIAGVRYLDWVRDRFKDTGVPEEEMMNFIWASYNGGFGHILDARNLAKKIGKDPNKWEGNVEVAIEMLSNPKHAKGSKYGVTRGREPVDYVRNIREKSQMYTKLIREAEAQSAGDG